MSYDELRALEAHLAQQREALYKSWGEWLRTTMQERGLSFGPMGLLPDELLPEYRAFRSSEAAIHKQQGKVKAHLRKTHGARYKRDLRSETEARRASRFGKPATEVAP